MRARSSTPTLTTTVRTRLTVLTYLTTSASRRGRYVVRRNDRSSASRQSDHTQRLTERDRSDPYKKACGNCGFWREGDAVNVTSYLIGLSPNPTNDSLNPLSSP